MTTTDDRYPPPPPPAPAAPGRSRIGRRGIPGSMRVATVLGFDIRIHVSWVIIALLVTWSLAVGFFPQAIPGIEAPVAWVLGAVAALLLFASVLAHELAHAVVARASGLEVTSITLFIFGGVSNLGREAENPAMEFRIAIVGPLTSIGIAAAAFLVAVATNGIAVIGATAAYLAFVNLVLGLFNLVPGFPLDGGRVLRSVVWRATGSLTRATNVASTVGNVVAWGLMLFGFWRVLGGDLLGGFWMIAIGWFLNGAASATRQDAVVMARLSRLRVRDTVRPDPAGVDPAASVAQLVDEYVLPGARRAVPVVRDGELLGLVTLSDIRAVPPEARATTAVGDAMTPAERLVAVTPAAPLSDALESMAAGSYEQVPVVAGRRLVGLLTRADILRELQVRDALNLPA